MLGPLHTHHRSHVFCKSSVIVLCCFRYIQSLANNLSFVRYKDVYSAAAEIIGLILKNMTEIDDVRIFPQVLFVSAAVYHNKIIWQCYLQYEMIIIKLHVF